MSEEVEGNLLETDAEALVNTDFMIVPRSRPGWGSGRGEAAR
jgi:hypothetical protein